MTTSLSQRAKEVIDQIWEFPSCTGKSKALILAALCQTREEALEEAVKAAIGHHLPGDLLHPIQADIIDRIRALASGSEEGK